MGVATVVFPRGFYIDSSDVAKIAERMAALEAHSVEAATFTAYGIRVTVRQADGVLQVAKLARVDD